MLTPDRTTKIAVSVPANSVKKIRALVKKGSARSVSAYVSHAVAAQLAGEELEHILDAMDVAHGKPEGEHRKWAKAVLSSSIAAR
jgi:Arc/MetJ-type ribon-helix-helix transcriptional regulator